MNKSFDLNIETVLDNWSVSDALREIIANALDEMVITRTNPIEIRPYPNKKGYYIIRDFGRGLQYMHLTQNESLEKNSTEGVIGKFGVGLKDAFGVLYRNNADVTAQSKYGRISLSMKEKVGFDDITTLNAIVHTPVEKMTGTIFVVEASDEDIQTAKDMFLYFRNANVLDKSSDGEIIEKDNSRDIAYIYVNGVKVAEEENFLFDYNITSLSSSLKKAINRERTNVGRSAYSDSVKKMLLNSSSKQVVDALIDDVKNFGAGTQADDAKRLDVQSHALRLYNSLNDIVMISASESKYMSQDALELLHSSSREVIIISDKLYNSVRDTVDYDGNVIADIYVVSNERAAAYEYESIDESLLSDNERAILGYKNEILKLYNMTKYSNRIFVSDEINTSLNNVDTRGVYLLDKDIIYIKKDVLKDKKEFINVLSHELAHALHKHGDNTRAFELDLGYFIGLLGDKLFK